MSDLSWLKYVFIISIIGWPVDIVVGTEAGILLLLMFKIAVRMNTNKDRK